MRRKMLSYNQKVTFHVQLNYSSNRGVWIVVEEEPLKLKMVNYRMEIFVETADADALFFYWTNFYVDLKF